jgi:peptidoglycan-associated lipoprotein
MINRSNCSKLIVPVLVGIVALSGCSQNIRQNDPALKVKSKTTTGGSKSGAVDGAKTGSIKGGSASSASQKGGAGGRANGRGGNYAAGGGQGHGGQAAYNKGDNDITPAGLNDPNNLLSQRIIYFDYNRSTIRPEYMVLLNTHAKLLAKYPNLRVRLEGHADERGSREYNVALSEDRARSVKRLMGTQGARNSQMEILGYGEELPLVSGHSERSWQKNRRVEIKYKNY